MPDNRDFTPTGRGGTRWPWPAALLLSCLGAAPAGADALRPYLSSDQNPFIQIHGLPASEGARVLGTGERELTVQLDITNNSIEEDDGAQRVVLDGETYRASVVYRRGFTERLEAGLVVPFLTHQRGVFDNFIEGWHDTFGLSNRKRTAFDSNTLSYFYRRDGVVYFDIDEPTGGLGDIRLTGAWRLLGAGEDRRRIALRGGIKWPTGEAAALRGSGGTDLSLRLTGTDDQTLSVWRTRVTWSLGALWLGEGDVLEEIRRDTVAVGHLGVARPLWRRLVIKAQLDAHTAFYDTALEVLGAGAMQFTLGGGMEFAKGDVIDFAIVENLFTDTTPDVVFHLAWRRVL